ncbi:40S ribosomal protein S13 [Trifolium repens]|nr:40S ribosomal protein S13 [Trifolium repens]
MGVSVVTVVIYNRHSVVKTYMYENCVLNGLMECVPIVLEGANFVGVYKNNCYVKEGWRDSVGEPAYAPAHQIKSWFQTKLQESPEVPKMNWFLHKALNVRKHLERNRKEKDSQFRLILVDSRIHRLARYYKKTKKLPPVWKYESTTATSALVA